MSKESGSYGASLMKKQGWSEGQGIGKHGTGQAEAVKVSKKDDVKGIGYSAKVHQTYSAQSVAFEDVISRIATKNTNPDASPDEASPSGSPTSHGVPAFAGKHAVAYQKRRNLKTGALSSADGKAELLGAGKKYRAEREAESDEDDAEAIAAKNPTTLQSPLLKRLTTRCVALEPKASTTTATVTITKPNPKPPKVTDTPFLA
uniref:PinX1-related protein 1 n=1 Tax=Neobodo designis TaxID=312471 RepID=A0A7S1L0R8_NEODS|mmetsp:Transcript_12453/g.38729  ORF Transcript_12453/g.38729 Transcript_12453/m.38729 type:complete len:203 (+) Transcript_12453:98-706(+)